MTSQLAICNDPGCLSCSCHAHAVDMSPGEYDDSPVFRDQGLSPKALTAIGLALIAAAVVVYVVLGGRP